MAGQFRMDDYVDVAERIRQFYERFPEGRLTTGTQPFLIEAGGKPFIVYHARAYRDADDTHPGDGWAWEPVPGPTQFTKDSELMNAETAAWGRAIVALGFETKKIASAQEVQARSGSGRPGQPARTQSSPEPVRPTAAPTTTSGFTPPIGDATEAQKRLLTDLCKKLAAVAGETRTAEEIQAAAGPVLTKQAASDTIGKLQRLLKNAEAKAAA
jgi:hypothetical protein